MKKSPHVILAYLFLLFTIMISPSDSDSSGLSISNLKLNNIHPDKMDMFEISFDAGKQFDNPYDPEQIEIIAHFQTPQKTTETIYGFWYEGFSRKLDGENEILTPDGIKSWKIRYTPRISGAYRYYIELFDHLNNNYLRYPEKGYLNFNASGSSKKGFIKVSGHDSSYLEFSSGELFLGFGHNLCGWEWPGKYVDEAWNGTDNRSGTFQYDLWLDKMHEYKANLAQFDFCESDQIEWTYNRDEFPFSKDWNGLTEYNQQTAWKMDYRINKAEKCGIYFRLTLLHWEDFDNENGAGPNWGWNRNPYNSKNNGPAKNVSDFFTDKNSLKIFKKTARYINARWGYSGNLLAYELWNEVDSNDMAWGSGNNFKTESGNIEAWHKQIAEYFKGIDPYKHLITTSFADSNNHLPIWQDKNIDFTTIHRYTYHNAAYNDVQFATVETLQKLITQRYGAIKKPVVIGEFALTPGGDIQRLHDKTGIDFHNQLWVSIMTKGAVTAMHWNWDSYIHKNNLYFHYFPIAEFFKNEDVRNTTNFNSLQDASQVIRYIGLKKPDSAYLWVHDKKHNFTDIKSGYIPKTITGQNIELKMIDGRYRIDFYNTYDGSIIKSGYHICKSGSLNFTIPDFMKDIAVKIVKVQN